MSQDEPPNEPRPTDRVQRTSLALERIALGEAPALGALGETEALEAISASNREILEALPAGEVVREVERRRRVNAIKGRQRRRRFVLPALGALVASAALILLLPRFAAAPEAPAHLQVGDPYATPGSERAKGNERLLVQMKNQDGANELAKGSEVSAGDLLQLSYIAADQHYGVIFSVDGRNAITQHLPEAGNSAFKLERNGRTALPSSYELDDAPDFERFYFVTGPSPFDIGEILTSAQNLQQEAIALPLPGGLRQQIFAVRKTRQ